MFRNNCWEIVVIDNFDIRESLYLEPINKRYNLYRSITIFDFYFWNHQHKKINNFKLWRNISSLNSIHCRLMKMMELIESISAPLFGCQFSLV